MKSISDNPQKIDMVLCNLQVISQALSCLPMLVNSVEEIGSPRCQRETLMSMAKQANAALAALGGFEETVKPGCQVQVRNSMTKKNI